MSVYRQQWRLSLNENATGHRKAIKKKKKKKKKTLAFEYKFSFIKPTERDKKLTLALSDILANLILFCRAF